MLAAAHSIPECVAVATIGAPFDTAHALHLFGDALAEVERDGEATVEIAGRSFRSGAIWCAIWRARIRRARIAGAASRAARDARAHR